MKKLSLIIALISVSYLFAMRIGVVNPMETMSKVKLIVNTRNKLKAKFEKKSAVLQKKMIEFNNEFLEFNKKVGSGVISKNKVNEKMAGFQKKDAQLKGEGKQLQKEFYSELKRMEQRFLPDIKSVINNISKEKKLEIVVNEGTFLYVKNYANITDEVIKRLNAKYKKEQKKKTK